MDIAETIYKDGVQSYNYKKGKIITMLTTAEK